MNKTQLVDALAERLGDRKTAADAVEGLLQTIVETVSRGETVSITGFGTFEGRSRSARVARNPRTGEAVDVAATTVPAFRAGATFRSAVGGGTGGNGAPARRATVAATRTTTPEATQDAPAPVTKQKTTNKKKAATKTTEPKAEGAKKVTKKDERKKSKKGK